MILRDYQEEAVAWLQTRRRGFIQAPAGSGKTIIAAAAVARRAWPGCRVVWLANTVEQVQQGCAALQASPGPECSIEVCCVQSEPDTTQADFVIFDECHHLPAQTWTALTSNLKPTAIVWGMSATPWHDEEERNECVRGLFQEWFTIDRSRVLASGHLVEGKVFFHDLDVPGQFDREIDGRVQAEVIRRCRRFPRVPRFEHLRRAQWQITQEVLQDNETRNQAAVHLARGEVSAGRSTLILVGSIEHGTQIVSAIEGARLCHSKLAKKARSQAIADFRSGALQVLAATSLADEGLDVPRAAALVLVAGGRSAGKLEQRAGRVLRPFEGKESGVIHDFLDRGAIYAAAQARARWKTYEKLGYNPEVVSYNSRQDRTGQVG